ncbi:MAG TPA: HD domain-containing phosphohydrolase [Azospira sp.]|nr:HD domain-containing phosphohydrolase [Azospira sp.]HNN08206.1 HD domain-containing phosphohydrolase [Azospira sp.]HNN46682.1 HD domain-containing phosphohydrolase [Azospira sp.]
METSAAFNNPIHRIILSRLAAAWVALSLLFGGVAYVIELEKIDDFVVALATAESERFKLFGIPLDPAEDSASARLLQSRAREFASENFVVIEVYNRQRQRLVEAVNPRHERIEHELSKRGHEFPKDDRPHYQRMTIDETTLVQTVVPLRGPDQQISGYFEGVFIVDQATMKRLREDLIHALTVTLVAVLLTTVALYPVILSLNRKVLDFSREVVKGNLEMASVLGAAIAKRDSDTNAHNFRVTLYAIALGEAVGIDATAMRALILGAFLHDVGKIGISDNILLKPAKLDPEEFAIMRTHVTLGLDILQDAEWLQAATDVVGNHHEKFDGTGYPRGLKGEAIPLNARIFAIVDVFDALASERPYKQPMSCEAALAIIQQDAGSHFDPRLVERFARQACDLHRNYSAAGEETLKKLLREKGLHYFFAASQLKPA